MYEEIHIKAEIKEKNIMEFLSNINLAKQTRMTDLRNTVIRR